MRSTSLPKPTEYLDEDALGEAGYPNGFDGGEFYPFPPYNTMAEAILGNLQAVGIRTRLRAMERAAYFTAWQEKKMQGLILVISAAFGHGPQGIPVQFPDSHSIPTSISSEFPRIDVSGRALGTDEKAPAIQTTSTSKVRRVDFGGCGPPQPHRYRPPGSSPGG